MLKKTLTYKDFDGQVRTEDFYFNLTEAELTELENSLNGGLSQLLDKISKEKDQKQLIRYFKEIVLLSYGEKSLDGRMFVKNDKIREGFASTMAYSDLFMELVTNADKAVAFVRGIMPQERIKPDRDIVALPGRAPVEGVMPPAAN